MGSLKHGSSIEGTSQRSECPPRDPSRKSQKRHCSPSIEDGPLPKRLATPIPDSVETSMRSNGRLQYSITKPGVMLDSPPNPSLVPDQPLSKQNPLGHAVLAPSAQTPVTASDGTQWHCFGEFPDETKLGGLILGFGMTEPGAHPSLMAPHSPPLPPLPSASIDVIPETQWPGLEKTDENLFSFDWMDMVDLPASDPSTEEQPVGVTSLPAHGLHTAEGTAEPDSRKETAPSSPPTLQGAEEYLLGDLDDADMAGLLDNISEPSHQAPPLSVIRDFDTGSRDGTHFDRNLQHSSPATSPTKSLGTSHEHMDLLDEDVDWDAVMSIADSSSNMALTSHSKPNVEQTARTAVQDHSISRPAPFVRPPLPPGVHDRPVIAGMSSRMVIRVCFRIGELLNLNVKCQQSGQLATFELFARVNYSSRENLTKTQHFQFKDLFTDRQPYPKGTWTGWRPNSAEDRRAQAFLGSTDKMCRVICRTKKHTQAAPIGWVLDIRSIRETTWDEMLWVRRIMARDDPESQTTEG